MNRITLGSARPTIARVLGTCDTDARVAQYASEAQERLMAKGKWVGTVQQIRLCLSSSCVTLPRQVETVEAWALCQYPGIVRDKWYEFVQNGPGLQRQDRGASNQLIDRGTTVTYRELSGVNSLLDVKAMVTEAAGARILLLGYDQNGEWIRTQDAGTWIDGEYVNLSIAGTLTVNKFTALTAVIKPVTRGPVSISEWPLSLGADLQEIAFYEADETLPLYRRYLIPNLENSCKCDTATDACTERTVTMLVKLRHIPVSNDNDFFILQNIAALKLMVMAIRKEEQNIFQESSIYEAKAIAELQNELSSFEGDGAVTVLRVMHSDIFGGAIENEMYGRWYPYYGCCP